MIARSEQIRNLYLAILNREPDQEGWESYTNSTLTISEITTLMLASNEYSDILFRKSIHKMEGLVEDEKLKYNKTIIYQDDTLCVEFYQHKIPSSQVVFSVSGLGQVRDLSHMGYFGKRLLEFGFDVVFFKTLSENFYDDVTEEILNKVQATVGNNYIKHQSISLCMGSFINVEFSKKLSLDTALLMSPNFKFRYPSVYDNNLLDKNKISSDCKYYIVYNPNELVDVDSANYYYNFLPKDQTVKIQIPDREKVHPVTTTLINNDIYIKFCEEILCNGNIINHLSVKKEIV